MATEVDMQPTKARPTKRPSRIQVLCARAHTILDRAAVKYSQATLAHDRAEKSLKVPAAISVHVFRTHPDFSVLGEGTRSAHPANHILVREIRSAIDAIKRLGKTKVLRLVDGTDLILLHKRRATLSAAERATIKSLKKRLAAAKKYEKARNAAFADYDRLNRAADKIMDATEPVERQIFRARSRDATDLLAKLSLYDRDPSMFSDSARPGESLAVSILRDIAGAIGKGGAK